MPYINYFNSFKELNEMVSIINTNEISNNMKIFNDEKKIKIYDLWSRLLETIK
jgi:hypothetical protein